MRNKNNYTNRHRKTLLLEIRNFIVTHQDTILNKANLEVILSLYRSLKALYKYPANNRCPLNWVLRYILEQAYWSNHDDSDYVAELINYVVENDHHITYFLILSESLQLQDSSRSVIGYYLDHANHKRVNVHGYRLVSSEVYYSQLWQYPIEMAVRMRSPSLVLHLLRYGAVWSHQGTYHSRFRFPRNGLLAPNPSAVMCKNILRLIMFLIVEYNPDMRKLCDLDPETAINCNHLAACGRVLLRELPQMKLLMVAKVDMEIRSTRYPQSSSLTSTLSLLDYFDELIPGLRCIFVSPISLKQVCKLVVRKALNDNWLLPQGIYQLQLPRCLERYLDLQCD